MTSRDHDHSTTAATPDGAATDANSAIADKIVAHLLKMQKRELERDTGHGYRSARLIALAIGQPTDAVRRLLHAMADLGQIQRVECINGLFWRSTNPLPWEPGGALVKERERLAALWKQPLTVIVQAGRGGVWRDEKAYPEGLLELAAEHVERGRWESAARRRDDHMYDRHLRDSYTPPPEYRLVTLSKAEGKQ